ncbi:mo25-like protein [Ancylostoma ceylanicum]|uniref:Mo25-like protein n=1 Tax=Ancylostoma ceylanicum TaxID=53326 RepID=A0A0D6M8D8_9BILA|nr:mo25-like protein [Ancylostoma ceylanicum]
MTTPQMTSHSLRNLARMPLPIFGKSHKSPADVVKNLKEALVAVEKTQGDKKGDKAVEEVNKWLQMVKSIIYGSETQDPHSEQVAQLAQETYNANVLPMLIKNLPKLDFESKKDVAQIFNNLLRRQIGTRSPTVEYLGARPEMLVLLVNGYQNGDIAVTCGHMLRECIRHDQLAKDLITRHKTLCAEFLDANYDRFFAEYQKLLNSDNYVTRRQSLKLLGELLLDRHNFNVMTRYISNPENLKLMMELLREKSRSIQFEAFHVFKVFVANPNKPRPIADILLRNREKLVDFLAQFHTERTDDEQFNDEKAYLIKQIQEMKA